MRKSVILIISTLSLLAIILIGLIFQRAEIYDATIYVDEIVVSAVRIGDEWFESYYNEDDSCYRVKDPEKEHNAQFPIPFEKDLKIIINVVIIPYTATEQGVTYYTSEYGEDKQIATINQDGVITFLKAGTVTFDIHAADNPATNTKIKIRTKDMTI